MIFTQVGRFIAGLSAILGVIGLGVGLEISMDYESLTADGIKLAELLVDKGFTCFLFGVILGVITDISNSLAMNKSSS